MKDLRRRVLSGILWAGGATAAQRVVGVVVSVLLARNLAPEDFAVVVLATSVAGFAGLLGELGTAAAIIQRPKLDEKHLSSGFWLNVLLATVMTVVCAVVSQFSSVLSDDPRIEDVLLVISLQFLITGPTGVHQALIWRRLGVRTMATIQTTGSLIGAVVALVLLYAGAGIWSIVSLGQANRVVVAILYWRSSNWRPQLRFDHEAARELFSFGAYLTLTRTLNYFTRNLDNLLIGKYLGATALGYYSRAYSLVLTPIFATTQVFGQVLFPAMARIQSDDVRLRTLALRALGTIALVMQPAMLGLSVVAEDLVSLVLGERWLPMAPVLQILAPAAMWGSSSNIVDGLYNAKGNTQLRFRVGLITDSLSVALMAFGLLAGIEGVSLGFLVGTLVAYTVHVHFAAGPIGLTVPSVVARVAPSLACSIAMAATVLSTDAILAPLSVAARLALKVVVGGTVYAVLMLLWRPQSVMDLLQMLRDRNARRSAKEHS